MSVRKRATKAAPQPRAAKPRAKAHAVAGVAGAPATAGATSPRVAPEAPAPVLVPDDDGAAVAPETIDARPTPALVFPTDEHYADVRAQVLAADPKLAGASERAITRAVHEAMPAHAARLHERARRSHTLVQLAAPVFPTDAHVDALNAAVPNLTAEEQRAVLNAGHAAFVASVAAGEPITEVPAA